MQKSTLIKLRTCIEVALTALGTRIQVFEEESSLQVRDIYVEVGETHIICFEGAELEKPFMTFEAENVGAAASAVALHIAKGIISRAVFKETST